MRRRVQGEGAFWLKGFLRTALSVQATTPDRPHSVTLTLSVQHTRSITHLAYTSVLYLTIPYYQKEGDVRDRVWKKAVRLNRADARMVRLI